MPRPKRKKLKFTEQSLNELLQEAYSQNNDLRAIIINLINTWKSKIANNDKVDIITVGKEITALLKLQDSVAGRRNDIIKISQTQILKSPSTDDGEESTSNIKFDDKLKSQINKMAEEQRKLAARSKNEDK